MIDFATVIEALVKLNLLDSFVRLLYEELDTAILRSRLKPAVGGSVRSLHIKDGEIKANEQLADFSMQKLFSDLHSLVEFFYTRLPSSVATPLSALLIPRVISLLTSQWLSVNLPTDVKAIQDLKEVLNLTVRFADLLESYQWCGKDRLIEWANSIPQVWLQKRCGMSLDKVRWLLAAGLGQTETVERVETQVLSHSDDAFEGPGQNDDWNADWSDDDETTERPGLANTQKQPAQGGEEEVSAWGFDDDTNDDSSKENRNMADTENDESDAWGWKDEAEEDEAPQPLGASHTGTKKSNINGHHEAHKRSEREASLKETYNITAIPKQILEIITQLVFDAELLRSPR